MKFSVRAALAVASIGALAASGAQAATTLSSSAYGLGATLSVLHLVTVSAGPFDQASGVAPPAYNDVETLASVADNLNLVLAHQNLSTGLLTSTATSNYPVSVTASGHSVVNNLSTGLGLLIGPALLNISATTLTSDSSVSDVIHATATGSSDIEGLTITGAALGGLTIDGSAYAHAAPNTVILNLAGLEIIANQQIHSGDNLTSAGIETNALVVEFTNFVLGTGVLNGDIIISHSQAEIIGAPIAMPEPSTWAMMLIGFGAIGGLTRQRQREAKA